MTEVAVVVKKIDHNDAKDEICGVLYFVVLSVNKYDVRLSC